MPGERDRPDVGKVSPLCVSDAPSEEAYKAVVAARSGAADIGLDGDSAAKIAAGAAAR